VVDAEAIGLTRFQATMAAKVLLDLAARQRPTDRWFTADEVVEIANETSDSFGNLYRLDFIDRIRHEEARS
jgi:hypothetical protein